MLRTSFASANGPGAIPIAPTITTRFAHSVNGTGSKNPINNSPSTPPVGRSPLAARNTSGPPILIAANTPSPIAVRMTLVARTEMKTSRTSYGALNRRSN
jgi:hypothetical protein